MSEKKYNVRAFVADDMFLMLNLMNKVGLEKFAACFDDPVIKDAFSKYIAGETEQINTREIGAKLVFSVGGFLIKNLPDIKNELYELIATLIDETVSDVAALPLPVFATVIVDILKKDDFTDFFKAVSTLLS